MSVVFQALAEAKYLSSEMFGLIKYFVFDNALALFSGESYWQRYLATYMTYAYNEGHWETDAKNKHLNNRYQMRWKHILIKQSCATWKCAGTLNTHNESF